MDADIGTPAGVTAPVVVIATTVAGTAIIIVARASTLIYTSCTDCAVPASDASPAQGGTLRTVRRK